MESNKKLFTILLWIGIIGSCVSSVAIIYDWLTATEPLLKGIFIPVLASNIITLSVCTLLMSRNSKVDK